jgi:hypothetical protein
MFSASAGMYASQESGLKEQAFNALLFRPRDSTPAFLRTSITTLRRAKVAFERPHWL